MHRYIFILILLIPIHASASTAQFALTITGENMNVSKVLELSDVDEDKTQINFNFKDESGEMYNFDLKYTKLPANRSYPGNLDITVKDAAGEKLAYLFWANNGVEDLQKIGVFGFVFDNDGMPVDVRFAFDESLQGDLKVASLDQERFVQDTLVSEFGFQMIRPVLVPLTGDGVRSQTYNLDAHPYAVNYTLKDIDNGKVEFQFNLYKTNQGTEHLLERIYYHAGSLATLRLGMFAGKYFDQEAGTIKLVFYPTMGQTQPPAK